MCTAPHHSLTPAHECTTSPTSPWYAGQAALAYAPRSCVVCGMTAHHWAPLAAQGYAQRLCAYRYTAPAVGNPHATPCGPSCAWCTANPTLAHPAPALCWPPAPMPAHWPLYAAGGTTMCLSRTSARHDLRAAGVRP